MITRRSDYFRGLLAFFLSIGTGTFLYGGLLSNEPVIGAIYDSIVYNDLGAAIWNSDPLPRASLLLRGYLYPTIAVGLSRLSPTLLVVSQTAAIAAGGFFLRTLAGRVWFAPISLVSITMLISPAHMMTEAFAFALAALAFALFVSQKNESWGVLALAIAALIKPAFLPIAVLSAVFTIRMDRASLFASLLAIFFFAPQIVATYMVDGRVVISDAGRSNFEGRFFPAVVGTAELGRFVGYNTPEAEKFRSKMPELSDKIRYVAEHPIATIKTWAKILWDSHLFEGSGYTQRGNPLAKERSLEILRTVSKSLNLLLLSIWVLGLFGTIAFFRRFPVRSWPAALIGPSLIASAPLVYWQGDRIIFVSLLLMLPFAGLLMSKRQRAT